MRVEDVWDMLPVNLEYPLTGRNRHPPLSTDDFSIHSDPHPLLHVPVCDIPDWVIDNGSRETVNAYFAKYPGLGRVFRIFAGPRRRLRHLAALRSAPSLLR